MNMLLETQSGHERRWKRYPAYKDSGVEWVGEVPEHWRLKRLKYISTVNDETLSETTDSDFELLYVDIGSVDPVLGIKNKELMTFEIAPSRARRKVCHGDVILSTVRTYLRAISPINDPEPNMIVSTGFAVIRPKDGLESRFAAYALCAPYFVDEVVANSVGVSYPAINANELITFNVALPPLLEQRAIAAFLDRETGCIDTLVAKKERQIEILQEKRAALISHAVTKGLDPDAPMKDSGVEWLGAVPEHWAFLPLKRNWQVTDCKHKTVSFIDEGVPVASIGEVQDIDVDLCNAKMTTSEEYRELIDGGRKPKRGDIIYSRNATVGAAAFVNTDIDFCMGQDVCLISSKTNSQRFLVYQLRSPVVMNQLESLVVGATFKRINVAQIKNFLVACPSQKEQDAIAIHCDKVAHRNDIFITKVHESISKLREYRTALISAAVTGKIDVREELVS